MLFKEGSEFKAFAASEIREHNIKYYRDFSKALRDDYLLRKNTSRGILIIGLKSTGKTFGVYQAVINFPSDKIFFMAASGRDENFTKKEILSRLKEKEYDLIFINEYSWFKDSEDGEDNLAGCLAGKAAEGVKVIITGTDSAKIYSLLNTDFIHRATVLNTTYFSYDEYCRLYELEKDDDSMQEFLAHGGIFDNHACESCDSLKEYIKTAIVDDLGAYYAQFGKEQIEAAVYKIFYECICKSHINDNMLSYEDFLEKFGIKNVEIKSNILREMFYKLKEIGVVAIPDDINLNNGECAYIANQTLSFQLTKYTLKKVTT